MRNHGKEGALVMMRNFFLILCLSCAWALTFMGSPVAAYEEMAVSNGGTVKGMITLMGDVPKPKGYNLTTLPDAIYCGIHRVH